MASFSAESAVEPLEFTLLPYADTKGVIQEPSALQIQEFVNAQRLELERIRKEVEGVPEDEALETTLERLGPKQVTAARKRNAQIYAAVCSGSPSAGELEKLPHRVFGAFATWLTKELLDPEAGTGAGNSQGETLTSAAAG